MSSDTTTSAPETSNTLQLPAADAARLEPYLPPKRNHADAKMVRNRPFVTLTFAMSLDGALALAPGVPTVLSGPRSKAMTHHLRARHAAILIGVGTAVADDPSLNCRVNGGERLSKNQPRPVVMDPTARWDWSACGGEEHSERQPAKMLQLAIDGRGRAPWVLLAEGWGEKVEGERKAILEACGGRMIEMKVDASGRMEWRDVLVKLASNGVESVMVEGGAGVINMLLEPKNVRLVDSVIITITPVWLGLGGVVVSPPGKTDENGYPMAPARLKDVRWLPQNDDVVLCGRLS